MHLAKHSLVRLGFAVASLFAPLHASVLAQDPLNLPVPLQPSADVPPSETTHPQQTTETPAISKDPSETSSTLDDKPKTQVDAKQVSPLPASAIDLWKKRIDRAIASLDEKTLPQVDVARARLQQAIADFDRFVGPGSNGEAWRKVLQLHLVEKELAAEEPDLFLIDQVQLNFRQNFEGLELPSFTAVRSALQGYVEAAQYGSDAKATIEGLQKQLKAFGDRVGNVTNAESLTRDFGLIEGILRATHQGRELSQAIRSEFGRPNARVLVSSSFLATKGAREVNEDNPVTECILGTAISGQSHVFGRVIPRLIANANQAQLRMELSADFHSDNQGFNRGVVILTRGDSPVLASESIQLGSEGLSSLHDTTVHTQLQTQIDAILHKRKIVRRIASKKAAEQKPQADAIGEGRMQAKIRNQYHTQLLENLDKANAQFRSADLRLLSRLGITKPMRSSWTSHQYLSLLWRAHDGEQLMAKTSCPLNVESTGVTLQLHQSSIANMIEPVLGNRLLESRAIPGIVKQYTDKLPEGIEKLKTEDPWSITLVPYRPVEVDFDDQKITIRIRASELKKGDQAKERPTIEATYRPELQDNAIQLVRVGDVSVKFPGNQGTLAATALRGFFKGKFDELFKEKLFEKPIRPLDRLPATAPKLDISSIQVDDEWLQIHLQ